jgi:hypothetical protein
MTGVPFTFASQTSPIPLADLDANFNTQITLGSTSVGLGNTSMDLVGLGNVSSANVVATNNILCANLVANVVQYNVYTVATLPAGQPKGTKAFVSDCNTIVFTAQATGGGAFNVPVYYDGTQWSVG